MFCLWDYVFCVYDHLKPYVLLENIVLGITGRDCCDLTQMSTLSLFFSIFLKKLNESMIHYCKQPSTPKYIICFFWWSSYPSLQPCSDDYTIYPFETAVFLYSYYLQVSNNWFGPSPSLISKLMMTLFHNLHKDYKVYSLQLIWGHQSSSSFVFFFPSYWLCSTLSKGTNKDSLEIQYQRRHDSCCWQLVSAGRGH